MKLETASLKTSAIGIQPACVAGTAEPAPTALALSLKGLQPQEHNGNVIKKQATKNLHPQKQNFNSFHQFYLPKSI